MTISFTQDEKIHAQKIVNKLLTKRRFFVNIDQERGFSYHFDEKIFSTSLHLQENLIEHYSRIRDEAEQKILTAEKGLGFALPKVPENRQIAQCNRYAGGFDIKSVLPLSFFIEDDILSPGRIYKNLLKKEYGEKTSNDFSHKDMQRITKSVEEIRDKILQQYKFIKNHKDFNKLIVIILRSRFHLNGKTLRDDLSEGNLDLIEKSPELLGYLFYEKSQSTRLISHSHLLFNTSRKSHVMLNHWNGKKPSIFYSYATGYDCRVNFASIF